MCLSLFSVTAWEKGWCQRLPSVYNGEVPLPFLMVPSRVLAQPGGTAAGFQAAPSMSSVSAIHENHSSLIHVLLSNARF